MTKATDTNIQENPNNNPTEDVKTNINMRVSSSLRAKMKSYIDAEGCSPNEFFTDMYNTYILSKAASSNSSYDFSTDIKELNIATKRICSIFNNMIEKSYLENVTSKELLTQENENNILAISEKYERKIHILTTEKERCESEYEKIYEEAQNVIKDCNELKKTMSSLSNENKQNKALIAKLEEQIKQLSKHNALLEEKNSNLIDKSLLEKTELSYEKKIIELEKQHNATIAKMQKEYNDLQTKQLIK